MDKHIIDYDFLYKYMKSTESIIIESLPREEDLSHRFSKKIVRKMNKLIRQEKRTPFMRSFISYSKRIAVIILIFTTIAFATAMSVEAYRVKFFEIVTEVWEEFTSIIFKSKDHINDNNKLIPAIPEYIPKGFSILEESTSEHLYRVIYINENNREILYEQRALSYGEIILDTENIKTETMEIGNQKITLFVNKGVNQIYWDDSSYSYTLISSINKDEIIKMAKSILEKNKKILNMCHKSPLLFVNIVRTKLKGGDFMIKKIMICQHFLGHIFTEQYI